MSESFTSLENQRKEPGRSGGFIHFMSSHQRLKMMTLGAGVLITQKEVSSRNDEGMKGILKR